jgi:hypothetical protein
VVNKIETKRGYMSKIPDTQKTKYNHNDPYRWVDSQWEKFMIEQTELKAHIQQLQEDIGTCTKNYSKLYGRYKRLQSKFRRIK